MIFADFVWGDMRILTSYRLHCNYEILRLFPNRVALCRRLGGSYGAGYQKPVHQDVTGIGNWEGTFILIADIHGILYELRPVTPQEWKLLWEMHRFEDEDEDEDEGTNPIFVGVDIFWDEESTARELKDLLDLQNQKPKAG